MKLFSMIFVLVLSLSVIQIDAQNNNQPITNEDVVRMIQEGLDEDIILQAIQTQETNFDTSPNGLIQLSRGKVSKKIIAEIQKIQLRKNQGSVVNSSDSSSTSTSGIQKTTNLSSTKKITSIATKDAESFIIYLHKCEISGTSVVCNFTITNKGSDRKIAIGYKYSELVDYSGNTAKYAGYKLGKVQTSAYYSSPAVELLNNGIIENAWIKFSDADSSLQKIGRLSIGFFIPGNPSKKFTVQFKEIPVKKLSE